MGASKDLLSSIISICIEMSLPIRYKASQSAGAAFATGGTRNVVVTGESLDVVEGYEGDTIIYTATVLDDTSAKMPATFVADLEINSTKVVTAQVFDTAHYDQTTGELTLDWMVPADVGTFVVKLVWAMQLI